VLHRVSSFKPTNMSPIERFINLLSRMSTQRWLLLVLAIAFLYFYSGGGPNQGSRFNLDRAILEQGQLTIDAYHTNSEDKAFFRGHYYCDKAPGASLTALPAIAVARVGLRFIGIALTTDQGISAQIHAATVFTATIPALFLCMLVYRWVMLRGHSRTAAVYAALALGLASPMWAYATLFWGNALAACCLLFATSTVFELIRNPFIQRAKRKAALAGFAAGWMVITVFPSAPMAVFLFLLFCFKMRPWGTHADKLAAFAGGALLPALVLGTYNYLAFDSPWHLGYASVQGFEGMKRGLFGASMPTSEAVAGVIWGPRGLLKTAPLLMLGLIGHAICLRRNKNRLETWVALLFSAYPVLLNVSYVYWDGGWSYGPRHSSDALPFMAIGLAPLFDALHKYLRPIALCGLAAAILLTVMAVATHPMTPYTPVNALGELYWPSFTSGRYLRHTGWPDAGGPARNFGVALGLKTAHSLIPLWIALAFGMTGLAYSLWRNRSTWCNGGSAKQRH
jgi:hypothetical protein